MNKSNKDYKIINLKEEIWEIKQYISSDICKRCSDMYDKLYILEKELEKLEEIKDDDL
jgi:patatin-like phospholipase/acyl hydrolase